MDICKANHELECIKCVPGCCVNRKVLSRRKTTHKLKIIQPYFDDVVSGNKTFEVRKNDRDFRVGDVLVLLEYNPLEKDNPMSKGFTGSCIKVKVIYILDSGEFCKDGYVIIGFHLE